MMSLVFQVEFLSDIVLPATSNNEGNIEQLDFIPGSNFLGMVAKSYDNFDDSFKVFHSGNVKFGDANILNDDKQTYKMPLSYFHKKLEKEILYNHHLLVDKDFKEFGQLKQKRDDYITKDNYVVEIDYNYSQKSAYDKRNRRSLDKSMYGYSAIANGTKWQFSISIDDTISNKDINLIKSSIVGIKRLGKSKSAQYGLVDIKELGKKEDITDSNSKDIILYANSRISLIDNDGNPTYDLQYLFDGLNPENIVYDKCQIKTSSFTPYNSTRQTKDYERICINKGSVIVLKNIDKNIIPKFVGAYQNEGFGEIILNPSFLMQKEFSLTKNNNKKDDTKKEPIKSDLARFLQNKVNVKKEKLDILTDVDEFIKDNKSLSKKKMNSQWGQIRSICSTSNDKDIYEDVKEYITHGVAKVKWEGKNEKLLLDGIDNSTKPLEFTKLLSMLIPKQKEDPKDAK